MKTWKWVAIGAIATVIIAIMAVATYFYPQSSGSSSNNGQQSTNNPQAITSATISNSIITNGQNGDNSINTITTFALTDTKIAGDTATLTFEAKDIVPSKLCVSIKTDVEILEIMDEAGSKRSGSRLAGWMCFDQPQAKEIVTVGLSKAPGYLLATSTSPNMYSL
jgi:hypothetical protein